MATTYQTGRNILYDTILAMNSYLYWPLGSYEQYMTGKYGYQDHSGNNRDGAAQGGLSVGTGPALSDEPVDSSTDFPESATQYISSGQNIFVQDSVFTLVGLAVRDDPSSFADVLFSGANNDGPYFLLEGSAGSYAVDFLPQGLQYDPGEFCEFLNAWSTSNPIFWIVTWNDENQTGSISLTTRNTTQEYIVDHASASVGYHASPGNLQLGMWGTGNTPLDGKQSHFAVFNRELNYSEKRRLIHAAFRRRWGGSQIKDRILSISPSFYAPLNAEYGLRDLGPNKYTITPTQYSSLPLGNGPSLTSDLSDSSIDFDGTNYFATTNYAPPSNQFTIVGMARRDSSSSVIVLAGGHTSSSSRIYIPSGNPAAMGFDPNSSVPSDEIETTSLPWTNDVITSWGIIFRTTSTDFWFNGVNIENMAAKTWSGNLQIGTVVNGSYLFNGPMSHIAVFESELSSPNMVKINEAFKKHPAGRIIEAGA